MDLCSNHVKKLLQGSLMKSKLSLVFVLLCGVLYFSLGCTPQGTGTLQLNLTDQPADEEYEEVFITFSQISVHRGEEQDYGNDENNVNGGGWIIISEEEQGYDLLKLQDGKFELLAEEDLTEGIYTQIRLKIVEGDDENGDPKTYVKLAGDGEKYPLTVPSGSQSGLKLIHPFRIMVGTTTVLFLDFNAEKSVLKAGNGQYKLKPTIAVLSELSYTQGIKGTVVNVVTEDPILGAEVFAFYADDVDDTDVLPVGSTFTNEDGSFAIPLPEGTYILKIEEGNYEPTTTGEISVIDEVWNQLESPIELNPL